MICHMIYFFKEDKRMSTSEWTNVLKDTLREDYKKKRIIKDINVVWLKDFKLTKKKFKMACFIAKEDYHLVCFQSY